MRIIFILVCFAFIYVIINIAADIKAPEKKTDAILTDKKQNSFTNADNSVTESYILYFDTRNEKKKFSVACSDYEKYERGRQGILTYKRNRFISFEVE